MDQLSNKEKYELKKREKFQAQNRVIRNRTLKRKAKIIVIAIIVLIGVGGLVRYIVNQPRISAADIISENGIHWHPHLAIYIKGKPQEIPANIGLGIVEEPIHTHDNTGTIHLEIQGLVTKEDVTLGRFFKIWGKTFSSTCIFEFCNGPDGKVRMTVNGQKNNEFENYSMRDNDQIEISYD